MKDVNSGKLYGGHVIFLSGGGGSFETAIRIKEKYGSEKLFCLFTDTLIEDKDLYRFLLDTFECLYEVDLKVEKEIISNLPEVYENKALRKDTLDDVSRRVMAKEGRIFWSNIGKDVWDIFLEEKFLGNSRLARCSHLIKQDLAKQIVEENFSPEGTVLYLGIDWTEEHRTKAPTKNWLPYRVEFPLLDRPLVNKELINKRIESFGIKVPRLYGLGFSHNNCGGFCVRAGQGHFANLKKTMPILFEYHKNMERSWQKESGRENTILRKMRGGVRFNYSLSELSDDLDKENNQVDLLDVGGCGCFVD